MSTPGQESLNAVEQEICDAINGRSGRPAAGTDPQKRDQIIDGAKRCFLRVGFEAATMSQITAEAGVSKGTIYVYFQNKEELFACLIDRERNKAASNAEHELKDGQSILDSLLRFGVSVTTRLTSEDVIRAQRMVLGVTERMPDIARRFFGPDPFSTVTVLKDYLDAKVVEGVFAIPDTELAARQFLDLVMASIFKRRLFGNLKGDIPPAEIERVVRSGVEMFLSYYAVDQA